MDDGLWWFLYFYVQGSSILTSKSPQTSMTTKEMGISVAHSRRYGACAGTRSRVHRGRSWRSYGAGG
ncbi:hypothetical protein ES319_A12G115400v1 [Gossypium barbadense]|uniref:Uncharacterized protein n=2 Tax=Gossypium TaxID=3633 RepID=A0A5J5T9G6_GOSBA|nr:hypothetical protein ES319_A12G115400v1 [Gossypium barbadense]TYG89745.1 hypothetical protein ES288_A12G125000v1 [Gossypium darwinii]